MYKAYYHKLSPHTDTLDKNTLRSNYFVIYYGTFTATDQSKVASHLAVSLIALYIIILIKPFPVLLGNGTGQPSQSDQEGEDFLCS